MSRRYVNRPRWAVHPDDGELRRVRRQRAEHLELAGAGALPTLTATMAAAFATAARAAAMAAAAA